MNDDEEIPATLPDPQAVLEKVRQDQEIRDIIHEAWMEMGGPASMPAKTYWDE